MTDNYHEVEWQPMPKFDPFWYAGYEFIWLYGKEHNELLLHRIGNVHLAEGTVEQIARATHWAPGPNPHYDEIYLPIPPEEGA